MYADGMGPPVGMVPAPAEISETSSEIYAPFSGENNLELKNVYGELPEAAGENLSYSSLDEALDALYDKELYGEDKDEEILLSEDYTDEKSKTKSDKEKGKKEEKTKWKKEGVSVCCLCRCLLPEGLACCPCGSTTGRHKQYIFYYNLKSRKILLQNFRPDNNLIFIFSGGSFQKGINGGEFDFRSPNRRNLVSLISATIRFHRFSFKVKTILATK